MKVWVGLLGQSSCFHQAIILAFLDGEDQNEMFLRYLLLKYQAEEEDGNEYVFQSDP